MNPSEIVSTSLAMAPGDVGDGDRERRADEFYGVDGQRARKTGNGRDILFVAKGYEVDLSSANDLHHEIHFFAGTQRAATLRRSGLGTAGDPGAFQDLRYYHANHVGSNTLVTNAAGEVAQETLLTPFGEQLVVAGSGPASPHLFTDQYRDAESGLDYFNARYYDSFVGRFLSFDPESVVGGVTCANATADTQQADAYAYARNSPAVHTDSSGRCLDGMSWCTSFTASSELWSNADGTKTSKPKSLGMMFFTPSSPDAGEVESVGGGGTGDGGSGESQSVGGTFDVPVVPGGGSVRTELFIASESTLMGQLAGDGRGFDAGPNPSSSRAFFTLDFESGAGSFQINPTCAGGGGSCSSALPIGAGNSFSTSINGNSISVTGSLTNSRLPGPSIDFGIRFNASSRGVTFSGYRNAYPSYEITRGSTFLYRGAETSPLRLFDATGFVRFSGP